MAIATRATQAHPQPAVLAAVASNYPFGGGVAGSCGPARVPQSCLAVSRPLGCGVPIFTISEIISARESLKERQVPAFLHTTALVWLRDQNEFSDGTPSVECIDLTDQAVMQIGVLQKAPHPDLTGTWYEFPDPNASQPWAWRDMFAAMDDAILHRVVGHNMANGIVQVSCCWFPRMCALERGPQGRGLFRRPVVWRFVVTLLDGTAVRFCPVVHDAGELQIRAAHVADGRRGHLVG